LKIGPQVLGSLDLGFCPDDLSPFKMYLYANHELFRPRHSKIIALQTYDTK